MKFVIIQIVAFIILSSSPSCQKKSQHEIESDYFQSLVAQLHLKDEIKYLVILPGLGCHGCIQEGEAFMKEYVDDKNIEFVLTNIESLKILKQKIGVDVTKRPNIYVDKDNMVSIPTDNKVYPCIIQIDGTDIKAHEFQSPMNSQAFLKLKSRITS
jgi:hypothetical protein